MQKTPDELAEELANKGIKDYEEDVIKSLKGLSAAKIQKKMEEQKDARKAKKQDDLCKIAENLAEYYKYLMQEKAEHAISIDGGIVEQGISEGPRKKPQPIPVKPTRVHEIIPYEQREKTLTQDEVKDYLVKRVAFDSVDKRTGESSKSYEAFIYSRPNDEEDGYLIIFEPVSGNKQTRTVYVPRDSQMDFLDSPDALKNNDFWCKMARHYLEMPQDEFRKIPHSYTFFHTSSTGYDSVMKALITDKPENISDNATKQRLLRSKRRLFGDEKSPDIKSVIDNVTEHDVSSARDALNQQPIAIQTQEEEK